MPQWRVQGNRGARDYRRSWDRIPIAGPGRLGLSAERPARFHSTGQTRENAFIESFNGRFRDECLNVHQFASLAEAQMTIEVWRVDYDTRRPHSSLGHLTPSEFVSQRQDERTAEEVVCSG